MTIAILVISALCAAFYALGRSAGSRQKRLTRPERKELTALREFKSVVRRTASTHQLLEGCGPLAQIILDEVDSTEKELDLVRNS